MWNDIKTTILLIILYIALLYALSLEAGDWDIWYKRPGGKYWHPCISITDSGGIGPVQHYIPEGVIIAIRDKEHNVLVPITRGDYE